MINKIEEMLRELYGYTDEQLLEEVRMAEEELERDGGNYEVTEAEIDDMLERMKHMKQ